MKQHHIAQRIWLLALDNSPNSALHDFRYALSVIHITLYEDY